MERCNIELNEKAYTDTWIRLFTFFRAAADLFAISMDTELDNFLLEIFINMPNWKPAENATGEKVRQRFEFSMGIGGC